jgi:hypothetical protein
MKRFWDKVHKLPGARACWEWRATRTVWGYGQFWLNGRHQQAHRVAYELQVGPVPDGLLVLHRCDNRRCVRRSHLRLGTHEANMADMVKKERQVRGERNNTAKLTEEQVLEIRTIYAAKQATQTELGLRYGVTQAMISEVVRGKSWKHLGLLVR